MIRQYLGEVIFVSARFGQNLRALRERAGLSQRSLAKRLEHAGPSTISHWESGIQLPEPPTITAIARAVRCTTADLMLGVVTPYDALRGEREQLGPGLILSDEETALITAYRDALDPEYRTVLRETILPAFAAATRVNRRHKRRR